MVLSQGFFRQSSSIIYFCEIVVGIIRSKIELQIVVFTVIDCSMFMCTFTCTTIICICICNCNCTCITIESISNDTITVAETVCISSKFVKHQGIVSNQIDIKSNCFLPL